jgi:hypothetical protein
VIADPDADAVVADAQVDVAERHRHRDSAAPPAGARVADGYFDSAVDRR